MQELQSLEDVFSKKLFRIPDYQRGYAWGEKQLTDFWEDLLNLSNTRFHYTGVISIKGIPAEKWQTWNNEKWLIEQRRYKPYFIVDGQQRLTTISIFIQCLAETLKGISENEDLADDEIFLGTYSLKDIKKTFILETQPRSVAIMTYKFGYEVDNPSFDFMKHKIFNEPNGGTVNETFYTLNLENAKEFFLENIKAYIETNGFEALEGIYCKLTQNFMFNLYEIGDDFDVFVAFETMNNRGKKLSDLELLKNRLIYLTTLYEEHEVEENEKSAVRDEINAAWAEVYFQLGRNKNHPLNDDDFLRAHWIMYYKYSRKKGNDYIKHLLDEVFSPKKVLEKVEVKLNALQEVSELKDLVEEEEDAEPEETVKTEHYSKLPIKDIYEYVQSLKTAAKHWYNSFNPENNPDLTSDESCLIDRLNRIGIGYFRPLVMASYCSSNITFEKRKKLFTAIERFSFLAFRLSRAMSNYKSSSYFASARGLYRGDESIDDILNKLEEHLNWVYNEDKTFKSSYFKDFIYKKFKSGGHGFYHWNGLRYFLFEYEETLKEKRNQPKISWSHFVTGVKDKVSIEHIYPQTPTSSNWKEAFSQLEDGQHKFYKGTLGNLLPLSLAINIRLQNDDFDDKKKDKRIEKNIARLGYASGSYSEQEVAQEPNWTPDTIKERGLKLLQFMEERWQIDLGTEEEKLDLLHINFSKENIHEGQA